QVLRGRLQFVVDNLGLSMDIEFQVRSCNPSDGRTGAQFQNLEPRDIATLRHIITSHLSGELISVGDVLSTLQRDNFTKARKQKDGGSGLSAFGRLKAVTVTLGVFVVGVAAFGFVAKSLYGMYFVSHAEAGVVAVPTTNITMPRDGTVNSLVEPGGMVVKGAPLASFSTSMLDML
ncbi:MAG: alginate biosynthesis protein Alg44, partial [Pseudomonas sp.]